MDKEKIIENLIQAEKNKIQINFFKENEKLAKSDSYQLQKNLVDEKKRIFNSELAGYKISMTSSDTQAIANTHEPAYGRLLDYNIQTNKNEVKIDDLLEPLLEPELVFKLNEDLLSNVSFTEIIQKSSIHLGAEIPDSRYKNWFPHFNLTDLIYDNAFVGKLVYSEESFKATEVAFEHINLRLFYNGELVEEGASMNVLGNPLNSIVWLNKKLHNQGEKLEKGLFISSGTLTSPITLSEGIYKLEFDKLGTMEIHCK